MPGTEQWLGYLTLIARGSLVTLELTFLGCLFAVAIAFIAGFCRLSTIAALRWATTAYVEFFRSTSIYVQLFWAYFALPQFGVGLSAVQAGVLALSLNAGAYGSEIVRAALQAVPREQREACMALNLTRYQSIRHVVLPQAIVMMLPPLGNLAIELMKGTAIVSLISIADLTFQAQTIRVQTGNTAIPFLASLALYFTFASVISLLFRGLERHFGKGHEGVRV